MSDNVVVNSAGNTDSVSVALTEQVTNVAVSVSSPEEVLVSVAESNDNVTVNVTSGDSVSVAFTEITESVAIAVTENIDNVLVQISTGGGSGGGLGESFETISKNLKSYNYQFNYVGSTLSNMIYDLGYGLTITKSFNFGGGLLNSITLSGNTPSGVALTKNLTYNSGVLTNVSYS